MSLQEDEYALSEKRRRGYNAEQQRRFRARRRKELDEMQELNNKLMNELKELKANLETRVGNLEREQINKMNELKELKESLEPRVEKLEREIDLDTDIDTEPESEPARQNRNSYPLGAIRAAISGWDNNNHRKLARGDKVVNRIWPQG
ncbi:hypothetical protein B0J13DRAFT_632486 [Dactylonectria estremocensis]|uniref:BZIP domain-containing protein n=1 Tax=Dactylonectria estremocensis TaxID=1079267 RepID=A0A9P9CY08_9HYPO|nr:hypothetical protein B0J13DRAFT_632486 [Dactylonectria estremocensis]